MKAIGPCGDVTQFAQGGLVSVTGITVWGRLKAKPGVGSERPET
jgi:hypothetical protein